MMRALLVFLMLPTAALAGQPPWDAPIAIDPDAAGGSLRLADVDYDGDLDAVLGRPGEDDVVWRANDGDGGDWASTTIATGLAGALDLAVGRFDADGDVDVVVGDFVAETTTVYINGDPAVDHAAVDAGTVWTLDSTLSNTTAGGLVRLTDLDRDGDQDVFGLGEGSLYTGENSGGSLAASVAHAESGLPGIPTALDVGDLDWDGWPDVLVANGSGALLRYEVDDQDAADVGSLDSFTLFSHDAVQGARMGDVDGDGDLDVVVVGSSSSDDTVAWYDNQNGDAGSWDTGTTVVGPGSSWSGVQLADVDRDGDLDILAWSGTALSLFEHPGDPTATWSEHAVLVGLTGLTDVHLADVDGDGDDDLVTVDSAGAQWRPNRALHPAASWPTRQDGPTMHGANRFGIGDLDRDGDPDLFTINDPNGELIWSVNGGDAASWTSAIQIQASYVLPRDTFALDIDLDGDLDPMVISALSPNRSLSQHLNSGDANSWAHSLISTSGSGCRLGDFADFDLDGDPDLVYGCNSSRSVQMTVNDRGSYTNCSANSTSVRTREVAAADIDRDGLMDVVAVGGDPDWIYWLRNDGDCINDWELRVIAENDGTGVVQVGDFDGDGDVDVVSIGGDGVEWYENNAPLAADPADDPFDQIWDSAVVDPAETGGQVNVADLDADGDADIAVANGGEVHLYRNNGSATSWAKTTLDVNDVETVEIADLDEDGAVDVVASFNDNDPLNDGIDLFLTTREEIDVSAAFTSPTCSAVQGDTADCVREAECSAVLSVTLDHTRTAPDDHSVELADFELFLHDGAGTPLGATDAEDFFGELYVLRDDGDGSYDPLSDFALGATPEFGSYASGVLPMSLPDTVDRHVAAGSTQTFFIELCPEVGAEAAAATVGIDWLPGSAPAEYADLGVPVARVGSPAQTSAVVTVLVADADADGDPDTTDCNDADPAIYTGAPTTCDGVDDDCDGSLADGFADFDGDNDPDCNDVNDDNDIATDDLDCDDFDATIYPTAPEICDGIDQDCDGDLAETFSDRDGDGDPDCHDLDNDNDGTENIFDCAEFDNTIFVGATELCDDVDQDCDGSIVDDFDDFDGDLNPDCNDLDDDEDGDPDDTDCDDFDAAIFTGALELCDTVDQDCDGSVVDEDLDTDGDLEPDCTDVDDDNDLELDGTDCDPVDPTVFPGADEVCDGIDQDCDGSIVDDFDDFDGDLDPDCNDLDDDEDGDPDDTDCADLDASIHSAAAELCDDVDQDCDGSLVDEDPDSDGDGLPDCIEDDADDDGLLDSWEDLHGLDPTDPSDADSDLDGDGRDAEEEETQGTDPNAWNGPTTPEAVSPVDGFRPATLTPTLVAASSQSLDTPADPVSYAFEVYADVDLTDLVANAVGVVGGADEVDWVVDVELVEDAAYWWRVRADDGTVTSPWTDAEEFSPDTVGGVIPQPQPLFPVTGDDMEPGEEFVWGNVASPDGLAITYRVDLLDEDAVDVLNTRDVAHEDGDDQRWLPDVDFGLQLGLDYSWRVTAVDAALRESDPSAVQFFGYGTGNDPPTDPEFTAPADGGQVDTLQPAFTVSQGSDPEGGDVTHTVQIDVEPDFSGADALAFERITNGTGSFTLDLADEGVTLLEETTYFARVTARDVVDLASGDHQISLFVAGGNDPPSVPELSAPGHEEVTVATPVLEVLASTDPEFDAISYEFRVGRDRAFTREVQSRRVDDLSWQVEQGLSGGYWWTARAIDSEGATSAWASPRSLVAVDPSWDVACAVGGGGGPWLLLLVIAGIRRRR